jgi:L-ornithine N5-monooxygenase
MRYLIHRVRISIAPPQCANLWLSETDRWFSIQSKGTRNTQLKEYKSTNYGVVNPRTIEHVGLSMFDSCIFSLIISVQLYELMYDQKVDQSVYDRKKANNSSLSPPADPQIVFRAYSNVVASACDGSTNLSASPDGVTITTQNLFTNVIATQKYDAIVCATGYQRYAWIDLVKGTTAGKHFGLSPDTDASLCTLQPKHNQEPGASLAEIQASVSSPSSSNVSASSTPPTSPSQSVTHLEAPAGVEMYVDRHYRLVPRDGMKARIYLQGVEEATHGLSDTLLSVMGVRAGEVIEDLLLPSI